MALYKNTQFRLGVDFKHYSKCLKRDKTARVIVPENFSSDQRFSVCYLLHPFGGNRLSWINHIEAVNFLRKDCIYVFPENGRYWLINDAAGNRYEDYFIFDLISAVEKKFPTSGTKIIGGVSMGGATAFFLALKHSSLFTTAFSIAGAFGAPERIGDPYENYRNEDCMMPTEDEHNRVWGNPGSVTRKVYLPETILMNNKSTFKKTHFIFEVGVQDYPRMLMMNRTMNNLLTTHNISHDYSEHTGDHSWNYFNDAFQRIHKKLEL